MAARRRARARRRPRAPPPSRARRPREPRNGRRAPPLRWSARSPPPGPPRERSPAAWAKASTDEGDAKRARSKPSSRQRRHRLPQPGRLDHRRTRPQRPPRAPSSLSARRSSSRARVEAGTRTRAPFTPPLRAKASARAAARKSVTRLERHAVLRERRPQRGGRGRPHGRDLRPAGAQARLQAEEGEPAEHGPRRRSRSSARPIGSAPAPRAPRREAPGRAAPRPRSRGPRGRTPLSLPAGPRAAPTGPGAG